MKKSSRLFISLGFVLCATVAYAQVGINTATPNGALDVSSTTDGLLVPRVALSATNVATVLTPTVSELVYNTFTSAPGPNQVTPGFYYWNGAVWERLSTGGSSPSGWTLNGNAGTDPATDFIGTTDAQDLVLRTSALDRLHISSSGYIGVSEPSPNARLDIVQSGNTGSALEVSHNTTTNGSSAAWVKNSGTGIGLHVETLNQSNNTTTARFLQMGTGDGLHIVQNGVFGDGIFNDVANGNGQLNYIRSNAVGTAQVMDAGGTGQYIDLGVQNGTGVNVRGSNGNGVDPPTAGGNVFAYFAEVLTPTPTTVGTVYGAVVAGSQYGVGHGILMNHSGAQGRNAELNCWNTNNADPALMMTHYGPGSAIFAQNVDNTITGTITVGDFIYQGSDVGDHIGVRGDSEPASGWGVGVIGIGGFYGVFSQGDMSATGVKPFTIDHPADPENKMLKHFAVESNEVLNMYRGVAMLDANGEAVIVLPDYFKLINKDYSYHLTAIGTPENPYVKEEIVENSFVVAGTPNTKVSWTVYADRNDPYMQQNPERGIDVVKKEGSRQGKYFSPELYGKPESAGMFYTNNESMDSEPATKMNQSSESSENIEKKIAELKKASAKSGAPNQSGSPENIPAE